MSVRFLEMDTLSPVEVASPSYAMEDEDGVIYIPVLQVKNPGHGEGGRFLDTLPKDRTIKVPGVINRLLAEMLTRRGYVRTREWSERAEDWVEVYVRWPE